MLVALVCVKGILRVRSSTRAKWIIVEGMSDAGAAVLKNLFLKVRMMVKVRMIATKTVIVIVMSRFRVRVMFLLYLSETETSTMAKF